MSENKTPDTTALVRRMRLALDGFQREADDAYDAGEQPDLWGQVVEMAVDDVRAAADEISRLTRERDEAQASIRAAQKIVRYYGGHQLWCSLFGEKVGWDDAIIHRVEPFVVALMARVAEALDEGPLRVRVENKALADARAENAMLRDALALFFGGASRFAFGDRVRKIRGSSWHGTVVGFYRTELTPIGYAVESEREPGSVQIYPETALEDGGGDE